MTRDSMEYIAALMKAEDSTPEHEVGWAVWMTRGHDAVMEYLTEVMATSGPGTRMFEIAVNVWLLMGGSGVAE